MGWPFSVRDDEICLDVGRCLALFSDVYEAHGCL